VQVLEIRRCTEGRRRDPASPRAEVEAPAEAVAGGGVVVPFPRRAASSTG